MAVDTIRHGAKPNPSRILPPDTSMPDMFPEPEWIATARGRNQGLQAGTAEATARDLLLPKPGTQQWTDYTTKQGLEQQGRDNATVDRGHGMQDAADRLMQIQRGSAQQDTELARSHSLEDQDRAIAARQLDLHNTSAQTNQSSLQALLNSVMSGSGNPAPPSFVHQPSVDSMSTATAANPVPAPIAYPGAPAPGPVSTPTAVAPIAPVDTSAAESAAFGRAKDQSGQIAHSGLTGLRSALGGRGMLGSGSESRGTASVVNRAQGELGDVNREQAITRAGMAQRNAETNYQGGITQRGQDIGSANAAAERDLNARNTAYTGSISQRGQDIGREQSSNSLALSKREQDLQQQKDQNNLQMQQYLSQVDQRGQLLKGLMAALSSGGSY